MGSMTPTMVLKDGEPILLTGTYGGAFIPSLVFNVVTNVVDQAKDAPYKDEYCCAVMVSGKLIKSDPETAAKITRQVISSGS